MTRTLNDPKDPMGTNIVHLLLETFNRVQSIPVLFLSAFMLLLGGLVYLTWGAFSTPGLARLAGGVFILGAGVDWLLLWLLPRLRLSHGPDRPSALALALVRLWLMLLIGVIWPAWWLVLAASLGLSALVFYSTYIAPFRLGVTHEKLAYPGWRAAPPLRLLHIADLHVEYITKRERRLNALIGQLKPDLIVFSGDFVNISYQNDPQTEQHIRQVIREWSAPMGVYCVQGTYTVEPIERVRQFVKGLDNLRLLENTWVSLDAPGGKLNLLGMTTTHKTEQDRETVRHLATQAPDPAAFRLLVTHAPDVAPEAADAGFHLYVCGHTHGGQLRFPIVGAVFSGSALGNRFVMGRYDLPPMTLYTSRGVGLEGLSAPRARFLCPPEITLWEITGSA